MTGKQTEIITSVVSFTHEIMAQASRLQNNLSWRANLSISSTIFLSVLARLHNAAFDKNSQPLKINSRHCELSTRSSNEQANKSHTSRRRCKESIATANRAAWLSCRINFLFYDDNLKSSACFGNYLHFDGQSRCEITWLICLEM